MKNAKTLTEGPLAKQILLVSLPLALSNPFCTEKSRELLGENSTLLLRRD